MLLAQQQQGRAKLIPFGEIFGEDLGEDLGDDVALRGDTKDSAKCTDFFSGESSAEEAGLSTSSFSRVRDRDFCNNGGRFLAGGGAG